MSAPHSKIQNHQDMGTIIQVLRCCFGGVLVCSGGFDGVFADGCRVLVFSGRSGVGVGEGGEVVEEGGAKVRGSGDFEGAAVRDDGVDDVLIASSSDIAVVQADVGGFTTFSGVVYATALVGCGEGFEGFPIGGVVGGVDAQLNGGVGGGFVLLGVPVVDGGVVVGTDVVGLRGICGCIVADAGETEVAPEDGVGGQGAFREGALPRRTG